MAAALTGSVPLAYAALYGSSIASDAMPFTPFQVTSRTSASIPGIGSVTPASSSGGTREVSSPLIRGEIAVTAPPKGPA
jgi:hypothetical protein